MRIRDTLAIVVVLLATPLIAVPAAAQADGGVNGFFIEGEANEALTTGQHLSLPTVSATGTDTHVEVTGTDGSHTFTVTLDAPTGTSLAVGTYANATTAGQQQVNHAGLSVSNGVTSCLSNGGAISITEATYDGSNNVTSIAFSWSNGCSGSFARNHGAAAWHATAFTERTIADRSFDFGTVGFGTTSATHTVTITDQGPGALTVGTISFAALSSGDYAVVDDQCSSTHLTAGASCTFGVTFTPTDDNAERAALVVPDSSMPSVPDQGEQITLTGTNAPVAAWYTIDGVGDAMAYTPPPSHFASSTATESQGSNSSSIAINDGTIGLVLQPPYATTFAPGTYSIAGGPYSGSATLEISKSGGPCPAYSGRMVVDDAAYLHGRLIRFAARFEVNCFSIAGVLHGAISFNSTTSYPDRSVSEVGWWATPTVGAAVTRRVTLTNHGPADDHPTAINLTGRDTAQYRISANTCTNVVVASGHSCYVDVRYENTHAYWTSAVVLNITDDIANVSAGGHPQQIAITNVSMPPARSHLGEFVPLASARLLDTRSGIGATKARLSPTHPITLQVTGRGGVPASAGVIVLHLTALGATVDGALVTAWAAGTPKPSITSAVVRHADRVDTQLTVPVGSSGRITLALNAGAVDVVADLEGFYSSITGPAGLRFNAQAPTTRSVDTTLGLGVKKAMLGAGKVLTIPICSATPFRHLGAPCSAVTLRVRALHATAATSVTIFASDLVTAPSAQLGLTTHGDSTTVVTVRVPKNGMVTVKNLTGSVDIIIDLVGQYQPPTALTPVTGRFIAATPQRLVQGTGKTGYTAAFTSIPGTPSEPNGVTGVLTSVMALATAAGALGSSTSSMCRNPGGAQLLAQRPVATPLTFGYVDSTCPASPATGLVSATHPFRYTLDVVGWFL